MANEIEAFTIALANMDAAVLQRMLRFTSTFFTGSARLDDSPEEPGRFHMILGSEIDAAALMQEIEGLINPVPPEGNALIQSVEDLQTQTRLKVLRARTAVEDTVELLAEDLLTGSCWLDLRKSQNPARGFGISPTAVWSAFRMVLPLDGTGPSSAAQPIHEIAATFIRSHPASSFYKDSLREPE
jgi:histidine ammonia-lyase